MIDIVRKIDMLRVKKGWTIYKLSQEADISQQTFHSWIVKGAMPSLPALENVCKALNITLSELFTEGNLIEVSPELKKLYSDWLSLTEEEKESVKKVIENYLKSKR